MGFCGKIGDDLFMDGIVGCIFWIDVVHGFEVFFEIGVEYLI